MQFYSYKIELDDDKDILIIQDESTIVLSIDQARYFIDSIQLSIDRANAMTTVKAAE